MNVLLLILKQYRAAIAGAEDALLGRVRRWLLELLR